MALCTPPNASAQAAALIAAEFAQLSLQVSKPDGKLKEACLELDGGKAEGTADVLRMVASKAKDASLRPPGDAANIDKWLAAADALDEAAKPWLPHSAAGFDDTARATSQQAISSQLTALEAHLAASGSKQLAGASDSGAATIADVAVAAALQPLLACVMGPAAREPFPATLSWFGKLVAMPQFQKILGAPLLCTNPAGWTVPQPPAKKGKEADGDRGGDGDGGEEKELDPDKAAKKAAKLAEKAAKAAKLAAKQAALKAKEEEAAKKAAEGGDKKKSAKADAEAKRMAEAEEVAKLIEAASATPKGQMKDLSSGMYKAYHPKLVEASWYDWWEESGFFKPDVNSDKPPFVIVIPPPNVTGALHIGHALTNSIQDTIVRWRRMSGYNTVWVPGTDHAGIATQTVVEKKLQREKGITRHRLGREKFLEEVFKWVDEYGGRICDQLRRIGSSVDWSRLAFTMDANLSAAVLEAFVRMHEQGIIYRDNRLVNWCCKLKTAISDIEIEYIDVPKRTPLAVPGYDEPVEFGVITSFAYPLEDGSGELVVATTRIETMPGDTAVAVHPDDERYKSYHGKFLLHPVNGRRVPIITDAELVDMSFGTGAVKVTPAHDPNDFLTGKRHSLEFVNILDDVGNLSMNEALNGPFAGMPRFKARVEIAKYLDGKGLLRGHADNPMRLGLCSRSKDVIEPVLKPQWWVNCKDMAARSCEAVRNGTLEIIPKEYEATWFRWLENIRDWCISRQLWWGHRIPAYYVTFAGEDAAVGGRPGVPSEDMSRWVVGRDVDAALAVAKARYPGQDVELIQDEDVLDTWFSSGLFPFSVFKWPQESPDLDKFYPGALLETGHDILFFWVARMVMMGLQLTDKVPFKQVYLHAMVRDAHGRKMSKSLGNVIDPLHVIEGITLEQLHATLTGGNLDKKEVERAQAGQREDFPDGIEECGTDALRFALCAYTAQARDINLDIKRVVAYRYWCNKLWNAIKFAMMNLPGDYTPPSSEALSAALPAFPLPCQWLLSRLNAATAAVVAAMDAYDFATATQRLYAFWQYDLCDVFIELMKPVMASGDERAQQDTRATLWAALETGLRLLHPFMPFVTEDLWQRLPRRPDHAGCRSIMVAPYPVAQADHARPELEAAFEYMQAVVTAARKMRSDYGLTKQRPALFVQVADASRKAQLSGLASEIATLGTGASVAVLGPGDSDAPPGCSVAIVDDVTAIKMQLAGILDPALEIQKLEKKAGEIQGRIDAMKTKFALPTYDKTPDKVKADDAERLAKAEAELAANTQHIEDFRTLLGAA